MQALVVYYSRTGHTKKVGDEIAKELQCDSEELCGKKPAGTLAVMVKEISDGSYGDKLKKFASEVRAGSAT